MDDLDGYLPPMSADVVLVVGLPKNPSGEILDRELRDTVAGVAEHEGPDR